MSTTITAKAVQELRERTGVGLMECKRALQATNGDIEAAIKAMREAGQAKADKKANRIAAEGTIICAVDSSGKMAAMLEINCETDFVARDANFQHFAQLAVEQALKQKVSDVEQLSSLVIDSAGTTVEQSRQALVAKIGENIQIRRIALISTDGQVSSYIHGGRIGVLVEYNGGDIQLGKDLAMHIAANNPLVVYPKDVPEQLIAAEKDIFSVQAQASGKPANIIEKMIEGRINKYLEEVSLTGQPFVKDPNVSVHQLLDKANASVVRFIRFAVGEGIEKQAENFVDAVMAQVRGN